MHDDHPSGRASEDTEPFNLDPTQPLTAEQRAQQVEAELRALIDRGELDEAARRLPSALDAAGPTAVIESLRQQVRRGLAERYREEPVRARRQRANALVVGARKLMRDDQGIAAGELVRQALAIDPEHPEGLALAAALGLGGSSSVEEGQPARQTAALEPESFAVAMPPSSPAPAPLPSPPPPGAHETLQMEPVSVTQPVGTPRPLADLTLPQSTPRRLDDKTLAMRTAALSPPKELRRTRANRWLITVLVALLGLLAGVLAFEMGWLDGIPALPS